MANNVFVVVAAICYTRTVQRTLCMEYWGIDAFSWDVCGRDGRLKENDQILAINGRVLSAGVGHQAAVQVLQTATGLVRLLVAHSTTLSTSSLPAAPPHHHDEQSTDSRVTSVTQQASPQAEQPADMVVSDSSTSAIHLNGQQ